MARYYIEKDPENPGHMKKTLICGSFLDASPIGTVLDYAGSSVPAGWLACNGQAVSRSEYKFLFNVIGTTYGPGDGSTTFNVPTEGSGYDLSNLETITAAQLNAGYTAQHSGWLMFTGYNESNSDPQLTTVNGVAVTKVYTYSGTAHPGYLQIPVKKGDILKGAHIAADAFICFIAPHAKPKIIKAKLEASAGDIGLKARKLDWSNAVAITKPLPYTATRDGYLAGTITSSSDAPTWFSLNGIRLTFAIRAESTKDYRNACIFVPVAVGDVLSANNSYYSLKGDSVLSFIPYI